MLAIKINLLLAQTVTFPIGLRREEIPERAVISRKVFDHKPKITPVYVDRAPLSIFLAR